MLKNPYRTEENIHLCPPAPFPSINAEAPLKLLARCPEYSQTPLHTANFASSPHQFFIKDERQRMGLGSFKALGAAYVIAHMAQNQKQGTRLNGYVFATASAGNHGLSVAAAAQIFGAKSVIFLSKTVPQSFADRLSKLGADVRRAGDDYEASMKATPSGPESHLRMPLDNFAKLKAAIAPAIIDGDADIIRQLRMVKSDAEIDKIRTACNIAGRAFGRVSEIASCGTPFSTVFRGFQQLCLEEGADWVPYVAGGTGPLGYDDVISPATDAPLQDGHIFMLDTGLVYDGYFCDFDRNYVVGKPDQEVVSGWGRLLEATEAGKQAVRPGACAHDIYHAMDRILSGGKGVNSAGRLGHGLGMQLTEWPSFMAGDASELKQGMVITLEPTLAMSDGTVLVHEDNFVITKDGLEQLSPQAPEHL